MTKVSRFGLLITAVAALCVFLSPNLQVYTAEPDVPANGVLLANGPCPWTISGVTISRLKDGRVASYIGIRGSFPIPPWERPIWFVSGTRLGEQTRKSKTVVSVRGGAQLYDKQENTIKVMFQKTPYQGASSTYTFFFDLERIAPGGSASF